MYREKNSSFKRIVVLLLIMICGYNAAAQVSPLEHSELNYRIIGFSFPSIDGATSYNLQIAIGDHNSEDSFNKKLFYSSNTRTTRTIAEVPEFATSYTWRVIYAANNALLSKSKFYHFSTGMFEHPDSPATRIRIITPAEKYADAFVFLNMPGALYDMTGKPVWYLKHTDELRFNPKAIRDLKITSNGTITFIAAGAEAYEIDYDCNLLWQAPNTGLVSGDSTERYNHEFTKLSNGNYMILGTQLTWSDPNAPIPGRSNRKMGGSDNHPVPQPIPEGAPLPIPKNNKPTGPQLTNHRVVYGTIMEYDKKGALQWSWKSSSYFANSDLEYYPNKMKQPMNDVHQNSFAFDEKNKVIYLSYKNIHRILKLKYPDGSVIRSYGEKYVPGMQETAVGSYCFQHSLKQSEEGYLYLFNNNSCHRECSPEILILKEPVGKDNYLSIIWNYEFPVMPLGTAQENLPGPTRRGIGESTVGGNVMELPDKSMFASLCSPYSELFIVNREKKVLWNAICERWSPQGERWLSIPQYRASIISEKKDLEQLIWHSTLK